MKIIVILGLTSLLLIRSNLTSLRASTPFKGPSNIATVTGIFHVIKAFLLSLS